jgi:hypothetical protein
MSLGDLRGLLKKQIDNYHEALRLERELAAIAEAGDFTAMAANTASKRQLLPAIKETYDKLQPLLQENEIENGGGRLADEESEKLRLGAISLLKEIVKIEAQNLEAVKKSRDKTVAALHQTAAARKAARGYRPQGETNRYLDIKS